MHLRHTRIGTMSPCWDWRAAACRSSPQFVRKLLTRPTELDAPPPEFCAVGHWCEEFFHVSHAEVRLLLARAAQRASNA
jgi:hypothetical protein